MTGTTKVRRVAGYVRQSKDERGDALSITRQEERIREVCRSRGWELVAVYADLARSAGNGKSRPELDRMLSRLGDVDGIVFAKLDRLARSLSHMLKIVERCEDAGVEVIATDDEIDTTKASGRAFLQMRGVFAEFELGTTSERYKAMRDRKRERGEWVGRTPYGWKVGAAGRLVAEPQQQARLRKAARAYIGGGTLAEAAAILGTSSATPTRRILLSSRVQDALGDLGDELAEALRSRKMDRVPSSNRSLLGGVARCAVCDGPLRRSSTRAGSSSGRWYRYRCAGPGHPGISAPRLEEYVSAEVLRAVDPRQVERRMRERQKSPKAAEIAAIEARLVELADWAADGTFTKAQFVRQRDRLAAKAAELREAEPDDAPDLPLEVARRLEEFWPAMTTLERRDVIRAVVRRVVISASDRPSGWRLPEDRVEIEWRT
jgi:DNA invertase Pin-like site-specific DNA recombinase